MKSLNYLLQLIVTECGDRCRVSTSRDIKTIMARIESEGESFLTITLANFGSDLQKGLDRGFVANDLFHGFTWRGGLPELFQGFLSQIFDPEGGRLLDQPDIDAIFCLRQITLMFSKIKRLTSEKRTQAAVSKYVKCEQDVRMHDAKLIDPITGLDSEMAQRFQRMSVRLWKQTLTDIDLTVYREELMPTHGPGSTADRIFGNAKWNNRTWTDRLETEFPSWRYLSTGFSHYERNDIVHLEPGSEIPVRVITVPKTSKTPRIIAIEPVHMQYMQQGIEYEFKKSFLKKGSVSSPNYGHEFIDYSSQIPNQELAKVGSELGTLATLDLSEASDRVSNQHVRLLLRNHPNLARGVDACRSRKADVPSHGVLRLAKFASMGSALCFPFEAMVFCTVVFLGIEQAFNRRLTDKDINSFIGQVRVYGDDIIVPVEFTPHVVRELENFGFRVNTGKSYWNGKFRESCGKDYYDGTDVTIVRLRHEFPTQRGQATEINSLVSLRNQLYKAGFWRTVKSLDTYIERLIPFPALSETSPGVGKYSYLGYESQRWDSQLHKPLVKACVLVPKKRQSNLDGAGALLKYFLKRSDLPFADREHLLYAGRPIAVDIKHRWVSPY